MTLAIKAIALGLVEDKDYRLKLRSDLCRRKVHPTIEAMLWHYAYGKPKDVVVLDGHFQMNAEIDAVRESLRMKFSAIAERMRQTEPDQRPDLQERLTVTRANGAM